MNDRFKFRVWDKGNEQYLNLSEVDYLTLDTENGGLIIGFLDELMTEMTYMPEKDMVVEQCTGLKDKNGKLIFEGDIIHEVDKEADIDDVSQIVWNQYTCHFMKLDLPETGLDRHCILCEDDSPYIEIIGNIHEQKDVKC